MRAAAWGLIPLYSRQDSVHRAYFAVFDGHGGVDAARYASVHVHTNASHQPELRTNPAAALKEAFRLTDEMFLQKAKREVRAGSWVESAVWASVAEYHRVLFSTEEEKLRVGASGRVSREQLADMLFHSFRSGAQFSFEWKQHNACLLY